MHVHSSCVYLHKNCTHERLRSRGVSRKKKLAIKSGRWVEKVRES